VWSAPIEHGAWRQRLAPAQPLWLGPDGLWDPGPAPRPWRRDRPTTPQHHASFEAWCAHHPGQAATLWLSAWWLHELLIAPRLPLPDDAALMAYAGGVLQHYHGDSAAAWPLAAWRAGGARGVSALHGLPLAGLQASAAAAGVTLRGVRPAWSGALDYALRQAPALARAASARLLVVEGRLVSQLDLAHGRLTALQQRRLSAATLPALFAWAAVDPATPCWALGHGLADGPGAARPTGLTLLAPLTATHPAPHLARHGQPATPPAPTAAPATAPRRVPA